MAVSRIFRNAEHVWLIYGASGDVLAQMSGDRKHSLGIVPPLRSGLITDHCGRESSTGANPNALTRRNATQASPKNNRGDGCEEGSTNWAAAAGNTL